MNNKEQRKLFAARIPVRVIERIRLERMKTGRAIEDIVAEALDSAIPQNRITTTPHRSLRETLNS